MAFNYKQEYDRYKRYYQSIQPELQKPVNRAYTAIIFSFLAVSLFGWYAIRPTAQTIFALKREILDKTDINKRMEDKISALIEAQAAFQELEPDIPLLDQALPKTASPVEGVSQLQHLADDTHVTLTSLSVATVPLAPEASGPGRVKTTVGKLTDFSVSLSVTGSYGDLRNFLEGVLDVRRVMQIEAMSFSPRRSTEIIATQSAVPTGTQIQLDLKLKLFYLSG